jgi:hypothetical protein
VHVRRIILLIGASVLSCWVGPAAAQILNFGAWDGSVEALVDFSRAEIGSAGATDNPVELETTRTEGRLKIRNRQGFLIDPRLTTFTFGGTFGLGQEDHTSVAGGVTTREERTVDLSGFDFLTTILPGNQTLSAELYANRNQHTQTRELAGRTDIEVENLGATLRARRLYIPSTLSVRRESVAQEGQSAASGANSDERRDVLRYEGLRGWVNKEMRLRYELVDKTDRLRPSLDYRNQDASLATSVDFGPDLDRSWDSGIRVNSREGFSAQDRLEINESLRISHGPKLSTSYRYRLDDIERSGGGSKFQLARFTLNHRLYDSVTTNFSLDATDQSFDDGQRKVYAGSLRLRYAKRLPAGGRLNAFFSTTRQREEDEPRVSHPHQFGRGSGLPAAHGGQPRRDSTAAMLGDLTGDQSRRHHCGRLSFHPRRGARDLHNRCQAVQCQRRLRLDPPLLRHGAERSGYRLRDRHRVPDR